MPGWKYAFSLSREAVKAATPPGTVRLIEPGTTQHNGRYVDRVAKHPVPTSDPADPLNWAAWRKYACLGTLCLYAFVASFVSASLTPALAVWNPAYRPDDPRPLKQLFQFVSFNVLVLGLGNIFWAPLANVFGRRPVLVLSVLMLFIASACGTSEQSFPRTLAIRIFQGLGSSVSETVALATIGDMFFVHERCTKMALYTSCLAGGFIIGGISGGYVAVRLGWLALFKLHAGLSGCTLFLSIVLVPETIYERDALYLPIQRTLPRASRYFPRTPAPYLSLSLPSTVRMTLPSRFRLTGVATPEPPPIHHHPPPGPSLTWYDADSSSDVASTAPMPAAAAAGRRRQSSPPSSSSKHNNHRSSSSRSPAAAAAGADNLTSVLPPQYPPYTLARSLVFGMYRGNVLYQFTKPWATLRLPVTTIVTLQYSGLVGSAAVISVVGPQILNKKPYEWAGVNSGLVFIGGLLGVVCGGIYTAGLADQRLWRLANKHDHGYAEPESRVPIMLVSLAVATAGLLVFGFCAQYPGAYQWIGLEFGYAMVSFALAQVAALWFCYLVDAYAQLASDCLVMVSVSRGLMPFSWTSLVARWVVEDGFLVPFGSFTVIMGVFALLTVPFIWTGKRMRIATARYVVGNQ
ncbi:major facilitator superfamily domain-containing protein [Echria macrotheca]|uniref:Major facilitator superfamily domain-containing protein n=1 Tax=Echria macrotheca TaxID=438768 RepID=A0AAJ0FFY8_9PEZI|nr:major facilitator superfamily domain-containing protein [Echria macrotheca]